MNGRARHLSRTHTHIIRICSVVLAFAACSTGGTADPFSGAGPAGSGDQRVTVTVENRDFRDATITANWDGSRARLGSVIGNTTQTFRVRWRTQVVYFEIDFLAGGVTRSQALTVVPGDVVELQILGSGRVSVRKS